MYYDFTVPIPVAQGKITCMKKGGIQYIQFETGRVYYPDRKYTIPQRVSIGKADVNHPGRMFPNEKYQEHFPDAAMPEERSEAYRSCALRIGSYVVIRKVLQEYKLPDMLPWSQPYGKYETREKENLFKAQAPPGNEKPRTPKKGKSGSPSGQANLQATA